MFKSYAGHIRRAYKLHFSEFVYQSLTHKVDAYSYQYFRFHCFRYNIYTDTSYDNH